VSLRITLKPHEKIYINGALISNGDTPASIFLENKARLLREKDILTPDKAKTVCENIYLVIQMMYFDPGNVPALHKDYWELVRKLIQAAPSTSLMVHEISECVFVENYYGALKLAKKLIAYEQNLMNNAHTSE